MSVGGALSGKAGSDKPGRTVLRIRYSPSSRESGLLEERVHATPKPVGLSWIPTGVQGSVGA